MPWEPDPLYQQISDEMLFDPLPIVGADEEHQVVAVDPGWFLSFDAVDSRAIRDSGAPE